MDVEAPVLILVLMEYALRAHEVVLNDGTVLILVLMEYALRELQNYQDRQTKGS